MSDFLLIFKLDACDGCKMWSLGVPEDDHHVFILPLQKIFSVELQLFFIIYNDFFKLWTMFQSDYEKSKQCLTFVKRLSVYQPDQLIINHLSNQYSGQAYVVWMSDILKLN